MENVSFVDFEQNGETVTNAIINHGDGSFTSMLKLTYDEQQAQAEQSTPSSTDEASTK
jgi:hypothetical protein